ncbi:hypothetical protein [Paenibacillus paridis]|uniref:hypothetical protein n=1 Tax=Paenibacillus paridis TaxID=2583376 RepID=UPI00111E964E|nr:hypothetical protein [Paenibacillus paridis]
MRNKIWMLVGALIFLIYGYDFLAAWISQEDISYFSLFLSLGGLLLFFTRWFDMKKGTKN